MAELIRIVGIACEGRHGVIDEERMRPQPFVVDLEIEVEASEDDLATTADYDGAVGLVRDLVATESFRLVETLARRLAEAVASRPGARSCRATVHKPEVARSLGVEDVSAEATAPG